MRGFTAAILVMGAATGCAGATAAPSSGTASTTAEVAAIHDTARRFSAAYVRGDAATMAALYTEDGVIFPEGTEAIRGRAAIQQYWTPRPGRRVTRHVLTPERIEIAGNLAHDYGRYEVDGEEDGKAWPTGYGKYVVVWKRGTDGAWRMHLDMWNRAPRPAGR